MKAALKVALVLLGAWLALTLWLAVLSGVRSGVSALLILGGVFAAGWMFAAVRRR